MTKDEKQLVYFLRLSANSSTFERKVTKQRSKDGHSKLILYRGLVTLDARTRTVPYEYFQ